MRLKNKKTGEIRDGEDVILENLRKNGTTLNAICIDEIKEEWEDAPEEPKEYWYIEADGSIIQNHKPTYINHLLDVLKSIGNYFDTREEAEQAVEKLKAFKRLKDKGFRFKGLCDSVYELPAIEYDIGVDVSRDSQEDEDLNLLFGGEK